MYNDVAQYISTCHQCQLVNAPCHKPYSELGEMPLPSGTWKALSMDFITNLLLSLHQGKVYNAIFMVVDCFTKTTQFIPCMSTTNAEELVDIFIDEVFKHFGAPHSIVSDCSSIFTLKYWGDFCQALQI